MPYTRLHCTTLYCPIIHYTPLFGTVLYFRQDNCLIPHCTALNSFLLGTENFRELKKSHTISLFPKKNLNIAYCILHTAYCILHTAVPHCTATGWCSTVQCTATPVYRMVYSSSGQICEQLVPAISGATSTQLWPLGLVDWGQAISAATSVDHCGHWLWWTSTSSGDEITLFPD